MHAWWLPGIVAGVILAAVALYVVAQPEWLACTYVGSAGVAIVASRGGGPVRTRGVRFADAVHLQMTATDHRQHTMIVSGSISLVWTNGFKREVFSYAGTVWTQETAELGHPAGPFCRAACTAWDERSR